ncbi:MAG: hypothetical protein AAGK14_06070 [Verrucomicrobiota bacterium]
MKVVRESRLWPALALIVTAALLTGCEGGDGNYDQRAPIYTQGELIDADYYDQLFHGN